MSSEEKVNRQTASNPQELPRLDVRLKANISDSRTFDAIELLHNAGCAVTTILVSGQPYPEVLLNGRYYRGLDEIREAVSTLKAA